MARTSNLSNRSTHFKFKVTDIGQDNPQEYRARLFITATRRLALLALLSVQKVLYRLVLGSGACVFKLVEIAARGSYVAHARHWRQWSDISQEDGLTEFEIKVTGVDHG